MDVIQIREKMQLQSQALSTAFALAAAALRYPDEAFAEAVVSGGFGTAWEDALASCGIDAAPASRPTFHELRVEATNLFYGMPKAAVSPYESVWAADAAGRRALLFADDVALDVRRSYRAAGLEPEDRSQPCDHVATELEFEARLLASGDSRRAAGFAAGHLGWLAAFADAVAREAPDGFYAPVCAALPALAARAAALSSDKVLGN